MLSRIVATVGLSTLVLGAFGAVRGAPAGADATPAARAQVIAYIEQQNQAPGGLTQDGGVELLDLSTGSTQTLFLHQRVVEADISPDGSTLLYGIYTPDDPDNTGLFTTSLDGSGSRTRVNPSGCSANSGKWSPDGSEIVMSSSCGLLVVSVATDDTIAHISGDFAYPIFSTDGKKLYFSDGGGSIYSYTLADQSFVTLADTAGEQPVPSPDAPKLPTAPTSTTPATSYG